MSEPRCAVAARATGAGPRVRSGPPLDDEKNVSKKSENGDSSPNRSRRSSSPVERYS